GLDVSASQLSPDDILTLMDLPVLVVDDNGPNARVLEDMLHHWHMKPTVVHSGDAAVATMRETMKLGNAFPLIVLDAKMSAINGFEVADYIRQTYPTGGPAIVMLSGPEHQRDTARYNNLGLSAI